MASSFGEFPVREAEARAREMTEMAVVWPVAG